jgi:hypothetical protein
MPQLRPVSARKDWFFKVGRKGFVMLPSSIRSSTGRVLGAAVAAAFVAAVVVQLDGTPRAASSPVVAGEAMMRVLNDEHAAIAGYLKQEAAARTQADRMATRDLERMKIAALEEAQSSLRLAQAATPVREEKVKASLVRVAVKSEPVRVTGGSAVAGEPMQLLAMTETQAMQAPPPRGLVRSRLHQLASTVERIPSWFNAAAGWVVDTVPAPRMPSLPQLPMRHFRV